MERTNVWAAAESALKVPQKYGFTYEYTYDKGSDSSCVYIHRFKKGADRFELRVLSGAESVSVVAYAGGEYKFPDLKKKYKKLWRASARGRGIARLLSKRTQKQIWDFLRRRIGKGSGKRRDFRYSRLNARRKKGETPSKKQAENNAFRNRTPG